VYTLMSDSIEGGTVCKLREMLEGGHSFAGRSQYYMEEI
jgi:hypothetical protein